MKSINLSLIAAPFLGLSLSQATAADLSSDAAAELPNATTANSAGYSELFASASIEDDFSVEKKPKKKKKVKKKKSGGSY